MFSNRHTRRPPPPRPGPTSHVQTVPSPPTDASLRGSKGCGISADTVWAWARLTVWRRAPVSLLQTCFFLFLGLGGRGSGVWFWLVHLRFAASVLLLVLVLVRFWLVRFWFWFGWASRVEGDRPADQPTSKTENRWMDDAWINYEWIDGLDATTKMTTNTTISSVSKHITSEDNFSQEGGVDDLSVTSPYNARTSHHPPPTHLKRRAGVVVFQRTGGAGGRRSLLRRHHDLVVAAPAGIVQGGLLARAAGPGASAAARSARRRRVLPAHLRVRVRVRVQVRGVGGESKGFQQERHGYKSCSFAGEQRLGRIFCFILFVGVLD